MNSNIKIIVSLEGNIGVGKSSFMNILRMKLGDRVEFVDEPVEEWIEMKNNDGKNLLEVFYNDKKRWSYTFQNIAYITRMKKIIDIMMTSKKSVIIMDRSLEGDINTFSKMLREEGDINDLEWQAYHKWNTFFTDYIGKNVKMYHIYLRCNPEVAYSRINKRKREEETSIPFDYIKKLHMYHDNWLTVGKENVFIVNVNKDFVNDENNKTIIYAYVYANLFNKFF
jgi:deoxyadenosine/deoxycytidine kinase